MIGSTPIPFESFMQRALHDPERGYYARRIAAVGRGGDFTTAPMISDLLARAIAAWAATAMKETGSRNLIEAGPGQGRLAADLLARLPWHVRWRTRLHLVETSAPLMARQKEALGNRATWHPDLRAALDACSGSAVIFSNELVDAFAVRRFQKTVVGWQELAVCQDEEGRVCESLLPSAALPESSSFSQPHPVGQWIEVHDAYRSHLHDWLPAWKNGRMLTIDYGATADRLYFRRHGGTIRGYLLQQRIEGPGIYENPGRQDLTADVNFTDLQLWSEPLAACRQLCPFRDFIRNWVRCERTGDELLTDSEGAGEAFLVLEQEPAGLGAKKP